MSTHVAVWTGGQFGPQGAKTAASLIRLGRRWKVTAVVDPVHAGQDAGPLLGLPALGIPVVADVSAAATQRVDALVIAVAALSATTTLPPDIRQAALAAIDQGWDVITGTHAHLADDPDLTARAAARGVRLIDLRIEPPRTVLPAERRPRSAQVLLTVGTDCSVGKMTTAILVHRAALDRGIRSAFLATGQTGVMCGAEAGVIVDHTLSDFMGGSVDLAVTDLDRAGYDLIVVEGQGAVRHPAYSGVTAGLLFGAAPDTVIACHDPDRTARKYFPQFPPPDLPAELAAVRALVDGYCPARLAGISLLGGADRPGYDHFGVPVVDVFAPDGAAVLLGSVLATRPSARVR